MFVCHLGTSCVSCPVTDSNHRIESSRTNDSESECGYDPQILACLCIGLVSGSRWKRWLESVVANIDLRRQLMIEQERREIFRERQEQESFALAKENFSPLALCKLQIAICKSESERGGEKAARVSRS